jgi:hypothetical protein
MEAGKLDGAQIADIINLDAVKIRGSDYEENIENAKTYTYMSYFANRDCLCRMVDIQLRQDTHLLRTEFFIREIRNGY